MRVGIFDHLGWAVAVTASGDHAVVDRRRLELLEPGVPAAPIHHQSWEMHRSDSSDGQPLDDDKLAALVADVRSSAARATRVALEDLAGSLPAPIVSISLRVWPADFPDAIAVLRRPPLESRADPVMYRQVLAAVAAERGWAVHLYDTKQVAGQAKRLLGDSADQILHGPRVVLGPPWTKDHRAALAATIVAG
ncbi:MAG: hypothetical protein ACRD07_18785 [Acidimicrobiales bacterium]